LTTIVNATSELCIRQTKSKDGLTWRTQSAQAEGIGLVDDAQLYETTQEECEGTQGKRNDVIC